MKANVSTFIGCDAPLEESNIVMFGVPFDSTTSFRPGTRFGPQSMRLESWGLETYSPRLNLDLDDYKILDIGDLEVPFGDPSVMLDMVEEQAQEILQHNKFPVTLGGEHLITLGVLRALKKKHGTFHLVHFDAHTDLREDYLGFPLSHASVMRRGWELVGDGHLWQFGIRSGLKTEFEWAKEHSNLYKFNLDNVKEACEKMGDTPVYVTIDLDILDPAYMPGTGTPEPGGIDVNTLLDAIGHFSNTNLIGFDIMELAPHYDTSGISTAAACKVVREFLLIASERINKSKK